MLLLLSLFTTSVFSDSYTFSVDKEDSPVLSYVDGSSSYQQVFNPTWIQASAGTQNQQGLLVRTQNCSAEVGGTCVFCGGSAANASVLTLSLYDSVSGSFQPIGIGSEVFGPSTSADSWGTEDPRMAYGASAGLYYMFYTAYNGTDIFLSLATAVNPTLAGTSGGWTKLGPVFPTYPNSKSGALLLREQPPHYLLWGDSSIRIARSDNPLVWPDIGTVLIAPRPDSFDSQLVEAGPPPLLLSTGDYLFFYNSATLGWPSDPSAAYHVGWLILSGKNPDVVLARSSEPLMSPEFAWELGVAPYTCNAPNVVFLEAASPIPGEKDTFQVYYGGADATIGTARVSVTINAKKTGVTVASPRKSAL